MKIIRFIIGISLFTINNLVAQDENKFKIIHITTTVSRNPASITFTWPAIDRGTQVSVFRKAKNDLNWNLNAPKATLAGNATAYTDNTVVAGESYEYFFRGYSRDYNPYTYIYAGVDVTQIDDRGKIILLIDDTFATPLQAELNRLEMDLRGDGWQVIRHNISRTALVTSVKQVIKNDYDADPENVKMVFLLGHIPVPYTGSIAWDSHPDHSGAWPCDGYYADMTGVWTDNMVNTTQASRVENHNTIGDGKFDQNYFPAPTTLQIGRVDLSKMVSSSKSEMTLLKQYLNKDHDFRHKVFFAEPRAFIDNNFGLNGFDASYYASCGWRSFVSMFPSSKIKDGDYIVDGKIESFLWAYGAGGGIYKSAWGVAYTDYFLNNKPKIVFNMLFGSYFGDWDSEDNFLRAPLASAGWGLASCWAGRPYWINHHTALGETIGYSAWITMRNTCYQSDGPDYNQTSINLMGDPSLRIHPVAPPTNLTVTGNTLNWLASAEPVTAYCIYRKNNASGAYTKIATTAANINSYEDTNLGNENNTYMVRAQKLEVSNSGSYYNLSQGVFINPVTVPLNLSNYTVKLNGNTVINNWQTNNEVNVDYINVQRSADGINFTTVKKIEVKGDGLYSFTDTQLPHNVSTLYYRLEIVDNDAHTDTSSTLFVNLSLSNDTNFTVFPNPAVDKTFTIQLYQLPKGNYQLAITDATGKVIKASDFDYDGKMLTRKIEADLTSGLYILHLKSKNYSAYKKLMVK
ncbi:MAG: T9SS C-terminal target domain-containing protein [Sphingobacteriales bacterium]|nr:MAG: T9SS C-terminal target domain-containing protein [Sphingobacteriales bacterium]